MNGGVGQSIGVTYGFETNRVSNRTRDYALEAYGWQMTGRSNAQILHNAWVSKIGFEGMRATDVTYFTGPNKNQSYVLIAREIIVSAGAIGSPKLLMLSGIGPRQHLEDVGIQVVTDIPDVGSNLKDHHFSVLEYNVTNAVDTI